MQFFIRFENWKARRGPGPSFLSAEESSDTLSAEESCAVVPEVAELDEIAASQPGNLEADSRRSGSKLRTTLCSSTISARVSAAKICSTRQIFFFVKGDFLNLPERLGSFAKDE